MIMRVTFSRAMSTREGVFALHRVDGRWVPITDKPDASAEEAIGRCLDDVTALLRGLEGLILAETCGLSERLGHGPPSSWELIRLVLQGLGMAIEGLERLGDEPEEWEPVELPERVMVAPVGGGNEEAGESDLAQD